MDSYIPVTADGPPPPTHTNIKYPLSNRMYLYVDTLEIHQSVVPEIKLHFGQRFLSVQYWLCRVFI